MTDKEGNTSQIDLSTGILLDSISMAAYLPHKSDVAMSLLISSTNSYYLYNTENRAIFYVEVTPTNTQNQIVLKCFNLEFYSSTMQTCLPCS